MSGECAQQDVQVSVGKDFVIMGTDRVEVSPDGKKVTAYTNGGVETKATSGTSTPGISISADLNTVVLNGAAIERAADGHLVISSSGTVLTRPYSANGTSLKAATHEIGDTEMAGKHEGEIYGGIYPEDDKPIWFLAAPKLMDHYAAAAWAKDEGGALPTRKQGDYLTATALRCRGGAFKGLFNRGGSFPGGDVWLAERLPFPFNEYARCQKLSDGHQGVSIRRLELSVLCVRR